MANTYTQVYIQFVFAVKHREALIHPAWKTELYKYITGIVKNNRHLLVAINGMPDHLHLLIAFKNEQSISSFMQDVKGSSSKWINDRKLIKGRFEWQSGYGAFAYSKRDVPNVVNYIQNQEEHHKRTPFKLEYEELLKEHEIDYNQRFVFHEAV